MSGFPGLRPAPRRWRALALVVFVMQAAVALSPLWETGRETQIRVHAEQRGNRHLGAHDEATCPVCAVRLVHAAPSLSPFLELLAAPVPTPVSVENIVAPSLTLDSANPTRAPPASV